MLIDQHSCRVEIAQHSAKAMQGPSPPGLPHQYQDFLIVLQAYAADFGKELNAHDTATFDAAHNLVVADIAKLNAVNFTGTAVAIQTYYLVPV